MKFKIVTYSLSWLALSLLIVGATIGLIVSFQQLEPGGYHIVFLSLAWIIVVASGIYLFIFASKEILRRELEKKESELPDSKAVIKKERQAKSETEGLNIDPVARKIVRRTSSEKEPSEWGNELLKMLAAELEIMSGVFYFRNKKNLFESLATYALSHIQQAYTFEEGEGLSGQAALNKQNSVYTTIPDEYTEVCSGLGKVKPTYLAMIPIVVKEKCIAVIECTGFKYTGAEIEQLFQIVARELSAKIDMEKSKNE